MENNLKKLPMDIIDYIKSFEPKTVYNVFYDDEYIHYFIGTYSTLQKAVNKTINETIKYHNQGPVERLINTYIKIYAIDDEEINTYNLFDLPDKNYIFHLKDGQLTLKYEKEIYIINNNEKKNLENFLNPNYENPYYKNNLRLDQ